MAYIAFFLLFLFSFLLSAKLPQLYSSSSLSHSILIFKGEREKERRRDGEIRLSSPFFRFPPSRPSDHLTDQEAFPRREKERNPNFRISIGLGCRQKKGGLYIQGVGRTLNKKLDPVSRSIPIETISNLDSSQPSLGMQASLPKFFFFLTLRNAEHTDRGEEQARHVQERREVRSREGREASSPLSPSFLIKEQTSPSSVPPPPVPSSPLTPSYLQ